MENVSNHEDFIPNTPHDEDANPNVDFLFDGDVSILVKDLYHVSDFWSAATLQWQEVPNAYTPEYSGHCSVYPSYDILLA